MSNFDPNSYPGNGGWGVRRAQQPLGYSTDVSTPVVARFFNSVYAWMAAGLALTAVVSMVVASHIDDVAPLLHGPGFIVLIIAQLALVWTVSAAIYKLSAAAATGLFMLYAALNGVMLSSIFLVYTQASIAGAFVTTAGMFGAMSLYGMLTQTDLSRLGKILFMALIGLIIGTVVNMFFASSGLYWLCTYAGVIIFAGLTAYDTQRLKQIAYSTADNPAMASRLSVNGALLLYLDFLNMFLFLLRLFGNNSRR